MLAAGDRPGVPMDQTTGVAWIVVGLALVFVVYLLVDWIRARWASNRLNQKKRLARESWEEEQDQP